MPVLLCQNFLRISPVFNRCFRFGDDLVWIHSCTHLNIPFYLGNKDRKYQQVSLSIPGQSKPRSPGSNTYIVIVIYSSAAGSVFYEEGSSEGETQVCGWLSQWSHGLSEGVPGVAESSSRGVRQIVLWEELCVLCHHGDDSRHEVCAPPSRIDI